MKATRFFASLILVAATAGAAQAQFVRCSWNTCDPQVVNQNFGGPAVYNLVLSMSQADLPNVGHDSSIFLYPSVPDAWRFDDNGCQTGSQLVISTNAFNKTSCPAMRGSNPFPITFFGYDPGMQQAQLRLLNTYDTLDPLGDRRYTLWVLSFDHSFSVAGPGLPGETCGGAEKGLALEVRNLEYLRADGGKDIPTTQQGDANPCLWNMGPVATERSTMGRLKAQYR
jgi:hypothetical protein